MQAQQAGLPGTNWSAPLISLRSFRLAAPLPTLPLLRRQRHAPQPPALQAKGSQSSGKARSRKGGGRHRESSSKPPAKRSETAAMAEFRADETLLFTPTRAARSDETLRVVYAYPNEYNVGITSLGYQLVWAFFETRDDCHVSRLFTDARDELPQTADLLGFSLSWELDYSNLLSLLEANGLPLLAEDRGVGHPLVFGGGTVLTANPEPYAAFFDVVLLGDGEDLLDAFVSAYKAAGGLAAVRDRGGRRELLAALATVPGVYVPSLYRAEYVAPDGPLTRMTPLESGVPATVQKQTYRGNNLARSTVVSPRMAWENIFMVEVVRSCPEMCRFCLASYASLPFRTAPVADSLVPTIEQGLAATDRIGLLGASVTQHPQFDELLSFMLHPDRAHVRMSMGSVRTNTVTPRLAAALAARGTRSLTVAVESGSERVRAIVNKKLQQHEIQECVENAAQGGLEGLKLYGMVGVPGEQQADVDATVDMMLQLKKAAPSLKLTLGCSTFVPKSHTPFQWYGVQRGADKRLGLLEKALAREGIQFRPESYKWSVVQALLSRGDRRLTPLLLLTRQYGDTLGSFRRAFKELAGQLPPMEYYVHDDYEPGEAVLPWSHLHGPLPEATLVKHCREAQLLM